MTPNKICITQWEQKRAKINLGKTSNANRANFSIQMSAKQYCQTLGLFSRHHGEYVDVHDQAMKTGTQTGPTTVPEGPLSSLTFAGVYAYYLQQQPRGEYQPSIAQTSPFK